MAGPRTKGKLAEFQPAADTKRIIPLQAGYAYLLDHKGKTRHMKRDSPEFVSLCATENEHFGGKIFRELESLGWNEILDAARDLSSTEEDES